MLATCCLNGSLLDLYIYVNYSILYSYGQINMSVCLCGCVNKPIGSQQKS